MPYDPVLADRMRAALSSRPDVREQPMFGGICWMLNGNMLSGVEVGRYMFRVGKERMAEALERPGVEPIVFGGRQMGGIVWVGAGACEGAGLEDWIDYAERFVGALPPK